MSEKHYVYYLTSRDKFLCIGNSTKTGQRTEFFWNDDPVGIVPILGKHISGLYHVKGFIEPTKGEMYKILLGRRVEMEMNCELKDIVVVPIYIDDDYHIESVDFFNADPIPKSKITGIDFMKRTGGGRAAWMNKTKKP